MSASFSISSSTGSYDVAVRQGLFAEMIDHLQRPTYIADAFFESRFTPDHTPIFLEATETEKSLDRAPALIETMRSRGAHPRPDRTVSRPASTRLFLINVW
jgi:hypothetical protein